MGGLKGGRCIRNCDSSLTPYSALPAVPDLCTALVNSDVQWFFGHGFHTNEVLYLKLGKNRVLSAPACVFRQKHTARAKHLLKEGDDEASLILPAHQVTAMGNGKDNVRMHRVCVLQCKLCQHG